MKADIHPKYNENVTVKCACGNSWTTGSVLESIDLEICNKCHPFYTGKEKHLDMRGRIEKFVRRTEKYQEKAKAKISAKPRTRTKKQETAHKAPNAKSEKKTSSKQ